MSLTLKPIDFLDDAAKIGCSVATLRAVAQVESAGAGFCPDGFPKTLFEGHVFSRLTKGKFSLTHPSISYPKWVKTFYGKTWQAERVRLDTAISLDRTSALMSASWGMFQIMGMNHARCGFKTVQQFVTAMCKDANTQLAIFTDFVIETGLADELRDNRWEDFARLYNGPAYAANNYPNKLRIAHAGYAKTTVG